MADIRKCTGKNCPEATKCYRVTARATDYQTYLAEVPYDFQRKECEYFWPLSRAVRGIR